MCIRDSAYQLRLEDTLGTIEVGKDADFVVLEEDLFQIDPHTIWRLQPSLVVMRGQIMHGALQE